MTIRRSGALKVTTLRCDLDIVSGPRPRTPYSVWIVAVIRKVGPHDEEGPPGRQFPIDPVESVDDQRSLGIERLRKGPVPPAAHIVIVFVEFGILK